MSDTEYTKAFKAGYDFGYKDAANENRYNTGVKVGINAERERIIKLLEADAEDWHTHSENCETGFCHCPAIELIKRAK